MSLKRFAGMCLAPLVLVGAFGITGIVASAILPLMIALFHGGWSEVMALPREGGVLLQPPLWLLRQNETAYGLAKGGSAVLWLAASVVTLMRAAKFWEYLVITKWRLMTRQEAEEFGKRDPGF
jgi:hypothetical protein